MLLDCPSQDNAAASVDQVRTLWVPEHIPLHLGTDKGCTELVQTIQATKPLGTVRSRNKLLFLCDILRETPPHSIDERSESETSS